MRGEKLWHWNIQCEGSSIQQAARAARRNKNVNEGNVLLGHNSIVPLCFNGTLGIIKNLYPIIIIRYNIRNFQTSVLYEKLLKDLIFIYLDSLNMRWIFFSWQISQYISRSYQYRVARGAPRAGQLSLGRISSRYWP